MSHNISSKGAQSRERACKSKFLPSRVQNLFLLQHQRPVLPVASNQLVFWAPTDYYSGPSRVLVLHLCILCWSFCTWAGFSYGAVMCLVCGGQLGIWSEHGPTFGSSDCVCFFISAAKAMYTCVQLELVSLITSCSSATCVGFCESSMFLLVLSGIKHVQCSRCLVIVSIDCNCFAQGFTAPSPKTKKFQ